MKQLKFKVNLGPPAAPPADPSHHAAPASKSNCQNPSRHRSRSGCAECKRRRVKCDETFPVCVRCQRRGAFCESTPRLRQWQVESPSIFRPAKTSRDPPAPLSSKADGLLLRWWLEKASQIMVIDPDVNPMSFPILEYVESCPSLVHAMQSVGAAHKDFFNPLKLAKPLEERNLAMSLLRRELAGPTKDLFPVFTTILLLGISSDWIEGPESEFGHKHLCGARALVDRILSDPTLRQEQPSVFNFILGAYIYWDMSCAFLIPSDQQIPIDTPEILLAVLDIGPQYHPIGGYCTEMFYLLGNVSRYCRLVVDTGVRDEELEVSLRHLMLEWKPKCDTPAQTALCEAFRAHGLINLALCGSMKSAKVPVDHTLPPPAPDTLNFMGDDYFDFVLADGPLYEENPDDVITEAKDDDVSYPELGISAEDQYVVLRELGLFDAAGTEPCDTDAFDAIGDSLGEVEDATSDSEHIWADLDTPTTDPQASIREQAIAVVRSLTAVPSNHAYVNLQPIPLLTAASVLTAEEREERESAIARYRELYSLNRVRANLTCIQLLEHLWELRDAGEEVTWVELMLRTGWYIMLG